MFNYIIVYMSVYKTLRIIRANPEGIWIRELAREAGVSPATICNYLYGYKNNKGVYVKSRLRNEVDITKLGNGAITIVKPK